MSFKQYLYLYGLNMFAVFKNGFMLDFEKWGDGENLSDRQDLALIWIIHLITCPITVPIFGAIKTLIDIFTRKTVSKDSIEKIVERIELLEPEDLQNVILRVQHNNAKSPSSNKLLSDLKYSHSRNNIIVKFNNQFRNEKEKIINEFKTQEDSLNQEVKSELKEKQDAAVIKINELPEVMGFTCKFTITTSNNERIQQKQTELTNKKTARIEEVKSEIYNSINNDIYKVQKDTIKQYLLDPYNNGKYMHQILTEEFSPSQKTETKELTVELITKKTEYEIKRLQTNGASIFGIGNNQKARLIESALSEFKKDSSENKKSILRQQLNSNRLFFKRKSRAFDNVFKAPAPQRH